MNHLTNSENDYACVKCDARFSSEDFLNIHIGASHKIKCVKCDFETGHKDLMEEQIASPGIWHVKKT